MSIWNGPPGGNYVYPNSGSLSFKNNTINRLSIHMSQGGPSITFEADGSIVFHEAYTVSEVAKFFWESLAASNPMHGEVERLKDENAELRAKLAESELRGRGG